MKEKWIVREINSVYERKEGKNISIEKRVKVTLRRWKINPKGTETVGIRTGTRLGVE